jgi:hypothetical protein
MPVEPEQLKRRELVVRVATLELLVSDLIHILRQVAPDKVDALVAEAVRDEEVQAARSMPADAENQRFRLHQVFDERRRRLQHRRYRAATHPSSPATD